MSDLELARSLWRIEHRTVRINGVIRQIRLVAFASGWLASVDTESGPTLGVDRSPYLAVSRALDPFGIDLAQAMVLVGRVVS